MMERQHLTAAQRQIAEAQRRRQDYELRDRNRVHNILVRKRRARFALVKKSKRANRG